MEPSFDSGSDEVVESLANTHQLSEDELNRLGRQRPEAFGTAFAEIAFCFSLLASMFMAVGFPQASLRALLTRNEGMFH
jgi:hypothetical protein